MNFSIRFIAFFLFVSLLAVSCEKAPQPTVTDEAEWGGVAYTMTPSDVTDATATVTDTKTSDNLQVITFDELPTQSVHGLTYEGVTFNFTVNDAPSPDARYNRFGPSASPYWQCPCLEGNSRNSVLTLTFETPTDYLEFGAARSRLGSIDKGLSVTLRDAEGALIETVDDPMQPVFPSPFTGALFTYESAVRIATAEISFPGFQSTRFVIDNLTYSIVVDSDGDGCLDDVDPHPNSNPEATVIIDGCDSEVTNQFVSEDGCSNMADLIADAAANAANHGQFVSQVTALVNAWKQAGIITGAEGGAIKSCAAQSSLPN